MNCMVPTCRMPPLSSGITRVLVARLPTECTSENGSWPRSVEIPRGWICRDSVSRRHRVLPAAFLDYVERS
jgi:hypothetical protein